MSRKIGTRGFSAPLILSSRPGQTLPMSTWRPCSTCKKPIPFQSTYWVCNVSTCNRQRTGLVFCSVDCWDAHVPLMRHRDAWSEERQAPTQAQAQADSEGDGTPGQPKKVLDMRKGSGGPSHSPSASAGSSANLQPPPPEEILVVASKVKAYIRARSGMNTSAAVMDVLSDKIRRLCDEAIGSAQNHERKTVLDRDF